MQIIQFKINDEYKHVVTTLLKNLKRGIIKDLTIINDNKQKSVNKSKIDIFSKTSGLLKSKNIDPIQWQNEIRSEWDR